MSSQRVQWVDHAKAISIILVVLTHSLYQNLYSPAIFYFSGLLGQLRMPLFFFISGLFIHKTINSSFNYFFKNKIIYFLYIYILWSIIRYLTDTVPRNLLLGESDQSLNSIFYIFIEPPATLWFIYALLIFLTITWITRSIPIITFCISIIIFIYSMQFSEGSFAIKLVRFYPLFLLGYLTSAYAIKLAKKVKIQHILVPIVFLFITAITKDLQFTHSAYGFFLLSCGGILSGIVIASLTARSNYFDWLGYVGQNTLPIYLMHFLPLGILKIILPRFMSNVPSLAILIMVISGVTIPLVIAKLAKRYQVNWLFNTPQFNYKIKNRLLGRVP